MKNITSFDAFSLNENATTTPKMTDMYKMFVQVNKDNEADKESGVVVPLTDVEYYTEQINNIYFDNVTGRSNFGQSKKWAKSLAKVSEMVDKFEAKMSGSTKGTAAGWIDGATELSTDEKIAVWDAIQEFIDKKAKDTTKLPAWAK